MNSLPVSWGEFRSETDKCIHDCLRSAGFSDTAASTIISLPEHDVKRILAGVRAIGHHVPATLRG